MDWQVKITVETKGPKEEAVIGTVEYLGTTKEVAVGIQNRMADLIKELNRKGV